MSKEARNQDLELTPVVRKAFLELVGVLSQQAFGEQGPPRETTFAEIETFGHQVGQMVARAVDTYLFEQHKTHFMTDEPCPACGEKSSPRESPHALPLQTQDGSVVLLEPAFRCPPCERDFFPSADPTRD